MRAAAATPTTTSRPAGPRPGAPRPGSGAMSSTALRRPVKRVERAGSAESAESAEPRIRVMLSRTAGMTVPTEAITRRLVQVLEANPTKPIDGVTKALLGAYRVDPRLAGQVGERSAKDGRVGAHMASAFGRRVQLVGWFPGARVLIKDVVHCESGQVQVHDQLVELTGDACPQCDVNPECRALRSNGTDTRQGQVGRRGQTRCLNAEDCGWKSSL